ncbi:MAG TPA: DUF4350 domain-containing protein [Gemmatimonadaceae bacterium]|nr:DUF4350 domain-containing protein [Gemmatimonadaceae bacterium]
MTQPIGPESRPRRSRRRIVLAILAAAIVLVALLTPEDTGGRTGDARLTSRSTESQGAAALFELAGRLGWQPTQRLTDSIPLGDTTSVHLVLDPPIAPSATETHEILDRVRRGAGLVFVLGSGPLADSLGLGSRVPRAGSVVGAAQLIVGASGPLVAEDTTSCANRDAGWLSAGLPFWPDRQTHILAIRWEGQRPAGARALATVRTVSGVAGNELPAVIGFPLGRGRVVVAADPDLLRNDVLRVCRWGADVVAIRMLEYASEDAPGGGRRQRLVFDEYHQGYGEQPGTVRGIVTYLRRTASGHFVLQLAAAGLVVLLAIGPRLIPPRAAERIERRSPLEHVDALARAYRAVGATRTATLRLVHGVRRRVDRSLGGRGDATTDDAFLAWARERVPARSGDIDLVRQALERPVPRRQLEDVGQALRRLEASLTSFPRSS